MLCLFYISVNVIVFEEGVLSELYAKKIENVFEFSLFPQAAFSICHTC